MFASLDLAFCGNHINDHPAEHVLKSLMIVLIIGHTLCNCNVESQLGVILCIACAIIHLSKKNKKQQCTKLLFLKNVIWVFKL